MDISAIQAILFVVAKEYKTTDAEKLSDIEILISLSYNELPIRNLGKNTNLAVAYLTAHKLKMAELAGNPDNVSGPVVRKREGDIEVEYSRINRNTEEDYSQTPYGTQLLPLLKKRRFRGFVTGVN